MSIQSSRLALTALLALAANPVGADVITVTTLGINAPPGECELDEAILVANDDQDRELFFCEREGGGPDVIRFASGLAGTVELATELPPIEQPVTIEGPGAGTIAIDAQATARILTVEAGEALVLSGLTLRGGAAPSGEDGGGLRLLAGASAVLRDCVFDANAAASGGAVGVTAASLRVERCTFSANAATGGAAGAGGAIRNDRGSVDVVSSTFSGNAAGDGRGAAIATLGTGGAATTRIHSSTVASSTVSGSGGAIFRDAAGGVVLTHTLLAGTDPGPNCGADLPVSAGYNLSDDASCVLAGAGDVENAGSAGIGVLAQNGGPTPTHALLAGSPAIDAGDFACFDPDGVTALVADQRGAARPLRTLPGVLLPRCDIGAYEVEGLPEPAGASGCAIAALGLIGWRRRSRPAGPTPPPGSAGHAGTRSRPGAARSR